MNVEFIFLSESIRNRLGTSDSPVDSKLGYQESEALLRARNSFSVYLQVVNDFSTMLLALFVGAQSSNPSNEGGGPYPTI
jgi:hypothetical protein